MTFGLSRIPGEIEEPISLADAKLHLRVDVDDDDDLIGSMITSARTSCEERMQRSIIAQTWLLTLDGFRDGHRAPAHRLDLAWPEHLWHARPLEIRNASVPLPNAPVRAVKSVVYMGRDGVTIVLDPAAYRLAVIGETRAVLRPVGGPWPETAHEPDAVLITYDAGWQPGAVPGPVLSWIKLRLGSLYANREEYAAGGAVSLVGFADRLLDPYTIPAV